MKNYIEIDFLDPKRILLKVIDYWYVFILTTIIAIIATHYYTKSIIPLYQANSLISIDDGGSSLGEFDIFEKSGLQKANTTLQNEIIELSTLNIANKAAKKMDLNIQFYEESILGLKLIPELQQLSIEIDWTEGQLLNVPIRIEILDDNKFILHQDEEVKDAYIYIRNLKGKYDQYLSIGNLSPFQLQGTINEPLVSDFFKLTIRAEDNNAINENLFFQVVDDETVAKQIKANLKIELADPESTVLKLILETPNKIKGERILNTIMDTYLENNLEVQNITFEQTINFIEKQITIISDSLENYENELKLYRKINSITSISDKGSVILEEAVRLENEYQTLRSKLDYYNNLIDYLNDSEGKEIFVPSVVGIDDALLNSLVTELIALQTEKSSYKEVINSESFSYIRNIERKINNIEKNLRESLNNAIKNTENYIKTTENLINSVENDIGNLPQIEQDLIKIERKYMLNESIYNFLLQKKAETEIERAATTVNHRIIDEARIEDKQIYPNPNKNYILAASFGIGIPLIVIIFSLIFNTKIVDIREVTELTNVPLIGTIPRFEKKEVNLPLGESKSIATEAFRSIRSSLALQYNFKDQGTILVTSTLAGEGKTSVSLRTASIYAAIGKKTLIIGMDLRKPTLHKVVNVTNKFGVTTYLRNKHSSIESLIQHTNVENLDILAAGPYFDKSYESINTPHFENLINTLKEKYDFIIVDTPPIALVSETLDLLKYTDIILYVYRQNYSNISQLDVVTDLDQKLNLNNIFIVVNDVHKKVLGRNYYGYGNYYGKYYGSYKSYGQDEYEKHT